MASSFAIGDFSRATHLTVKTLRHYHETGLLQPALVDPQTGYRRYTTEQVPVAQIIRRFRDLDMPLDVIRAVLSAPDVPTRNELIAAHLKRLESELARTQGAVASLRNLLEHPVLPVNIGRRRADQVNAAAISEVVATKDALSWYLGALGELRAALSAQRKIATGPAGGIFSNAIFSHARGEATVFIPCEGTVRAIGRVTARVVPAVELATIVHAGSHANIDLAYGSLATYVTEHTLAVEGPLREYYLVGPQDTPEECAWRTEIGWPIFQTRMGTAGTEQIASPAPAPQRFAVADAQNLHIDLDEAIIRDLIDTRDGATYFAERVWGVSLRYDLGGSHPLVGRSAPDFELVDGTKLGELLRNGRGLFLDFDTRSPLHALASR
jgi:DNA-binding transcriptional MerR regulator